LHLRDPALDQMLLHLEVGDAVHQQSADPIGALVERDRMTGARELLRACHPGRTRANHRDALSTAARGRLRRDPSLGPGMIDDVLLDQLYGYRIVVDVENAGLLAWGGTHAAGEFREVVGRMQPVDRFLPAPAIHEVVPVRDDIPERATLVAEGNSAIHAARTLRAQLVFGHLELVLAPVVQALRDRTPPRQLAIDLHEARYLSHRSLILPGLISRARLLLTPPPALPSRC